MIRLVGQSASRFPMRQIIAVVEIGRKPVGLPLRIGIDKLLELRVGHQISINIEIAERDSMPRQFIAEQLRRLDVKNFLEMRNLGWGDSHVSRGAMN